MTNDEMPKRFYRLLYFCPRPEDDERVCVGLLLHDENGSYLDYDNKLEKAHCFAPDYTRESLAFVLGTIGEQADKAASRGHLEQFSPQFALSAPRALLRPIDDQVRSVLRHRYLLKLRSEERKTREKGLGRKIDQYISKNLDIPPSALRRQATASDLFGKAVVQELPKDLVPRPVSRAVVLDTGMCLMDGVDLHLPSPEVLAQRISRVVHTFWQCKKIEKLTGRRKILTAAIVFNGNGHAVSDRFKWRLDYAVDQFQKDADVTVHVGVPDQEQMLREMMKSVAPLNRLLPRGEEKS
jgi:hypothetical protein